ncbi:hypothetical protein ACFL9T_03660 [Thermodesulfobacteriota bacterium]
MKLSYLLLICTVLIAWVVIFHLDNSLSGSYPVPAHQAERQIYNRNTGSIIKVSTNRHGNTLKLTGGNRGKVHFVLSSSRSHGYRAGYRGLYKPYYGNRQAYKHYRPGYYQKGHHKRYYHKKHYRYGRHKRYYGHGYRRHPKRYYGRYPGRRYGYASPDKVAILQIRWLQTESGDRVLMVKASSDAPSGSVTLTADLIYDGGAIMSGALNYDSEKGYYVGVFRNIRGDPDTVIVSSSGYGSIEKRVPYS